MHNSKVAYKHLLGVIACTLNGTCLTEGVVYKTNVKRRDNKKWVGGFLLIIVSPPSHVEVELGFDSIDNEKAKLSAR